jgi:hypothetical protein
MVAAVLVLLGCLLLPGGCYAWYAWQSRSTQGQLAAARARWAARPFVNYRMVVNTASPHWQCHQDVDVTREQMVTVREDSCGRSLPTVSRLFDEIDTIQEQADMQAALMSSDQRACYRSSRVMARYDTLHGYPQHIEWRFASHLDWASPALWQHLWATGALPSCNTWTMQGWLHVHVQPLAP